MLSTRQWHLKKKYCFISLYIEYTFPFKTTVKDALKDNITEHPVHEALEQNNEQVDVVSSCYIVLKPDEWERLSKQRKYTWRLKHAREEKYEIREKRRNIGGSM